MFYGFEPFVFAAGVVKHWNKSLREVMESLFLETVKTQLDTALNNLL